MSSIDRVLEPKRDGTKPEDGEVTSPATRAPAAAKSLILLL